MATPLSADRQVAALRAEGVRLVERDGWRTHNRNSAGPWGGVNGILIHHTAGTDSLDLVWSGRSDLPGPLAHTHLAKNGTATMTGNGRANHAGKVARNAYDAVVAESSVHPAPSAGSGTVDGNRHFYGIEIENLGNGDDPYPAVQYDAAVRWAAALCRAHGWSEHSVVGHKETSIEGKIDPSFGMARFREAVAERLAHPADWSPVPEDDMPETLGQYETADRTLQPSTWTALPIEGTNLFKGARAYTAMVQLTVVLPAGATLQGRFVHVDSDGGRWTSGLSERPATEGTTFADFHDAGSVSPSQAVRFECAYFPAAGGDGGPVTVTTARVRGLYWK